MANQADKSQRTGLIIMAAACVVMLALGGTAVKALAGTGQMQAGAGAAALTDGEYKAELSGSGGETAETSIVTLTVKNGKIESCNWDIQEPDGTLKSKLSMDGQYIMTEDGLLWHEQADMLEDIVIANNGDSTLVTGEDGKLVDQSSGVSINISEFKAGVENCIAQAGGPAAPESAAAE